MSSKFERLTDEAIDKLASYNMAEATEAMIGIADYFAKAGFSQKEFAEYRVYMIQTAKMRLGIKSLPNDAHCVFNHFIKEAEKAAYNERNRDERAIISH